MFLTYADNQLCYKCNIEHMFLSSIKEPINVQEGYSEYGECRYDRNNVSHRCDADVRRPAPCPWSFYILLRQKVQKPLDE